MQANLITYHLLISKIAESQININRYIQGDFSKVLKEQRTPSSYPLLYADDPTFQLSPREDNLVDVDCALMVLYPVEQANHFHKKQLSDNLYRTAEQICNYMRQYIINTSGENLPTFLIEPLEGVTADTYLGWGITFKYKGHGVSCLDDTWDHDGVGITLAPIFIVTSDGPFPSIQILVESHGQAIDSYSFKTQIDKGPIVEHAPDTIPEFTDQGNLLKIQLTAIQDGEEKYASAIIRPHRQKTISYHEKIFS